MAERRESGEQGENATEGSEAAVVARRAARHDRRAAAIHAMLEKIMPTQSSVPVDAVEMRRDRARVTASRGIVKKTAACYLTAHAYGRTAVTETPRTKYSNNKDIAVYL